MLRQQNVNKLKQLRLFGMEQEYENQCSNIQLQNSSCDERIGMMLDAQQHYQKNKQQERWIRESKLKVLACPEDIDYKPSRGIDREVYANLLRCDWVARGQHIIITGPTGVGKTWHGCAFAHQAIRLGYPALYIRLPRLVEEVELAYQVGELPKYRKKIFKKNLVVLDDWALSPLTDRSRQELLEIIDDRAGIGSLLITSQLPVEQWHDFIGEATIADAILDRLVHNAHHIKLQGESMRKSNSHIQLPDESALKLTSDKAVSA